MSHPPSPPSPLALASRGSARLCTDPAVVNDVRPHPSLSRHRSLPNLKPRPGPAPTGPLPLPPRSAAPSANNARIVPWFPFEAPVSLQLTTAELTTDSTLVHGLPRQR